MEAVTRTDRIFSRAIQGALVLVLIACCYAMWRIAMIAYRLEEAIVAVSSDVKEVSAAGAQVSQQLAAVADKLSRLEQKSSEAVGLDEFEQA